MKHSAELITIAGMLICLGAVGFVVFCTMSSNLKYQKGEVVSRTGRRFT
jgi:hypothetical protein